MKNSFDTRGTLEIGDKTYIYYRLGNTGDVARLPYSMKILLENLLRREDGEVVKRSDVEAVINWDAKAEPSKEIAYMPARVLMQDFTGVPAVVDLAAMRDALVALGGDAGQINPLAPTELVIDHSVQVDVFGSDDAMAKNIKLEFARNRERYSFLKWGQKAFDNFKVVPPDTGIVHQINLEHLARTVFVDRDNVACPDTLVGTDSHTTMINGLGVLGWGVGGIEAEAAMLGQPISMLIPKVVGFELTGALPEGATATDLVLTVVEMLRTYGVVGKFVEFHGDGLDHLPLADRATIANMAPEYGATCGIFPIDGETLSYLRLTGRSEEQIALVETYAKAQGMFRNGSVSLDYSETLSLDMTMVEPSLAGPRRPQDRVPLSDIKTSVAHALQAAMDINGQSLERFEGEGGHNADVGQQSAEHASGYRRKGVSITMNGQDFELADGDVVIAAITSCTNTSNPSVMLGAGLMAKKAVALGLKSAPWVKTSLGPGSMVVTRYLEDARLMEPLKLLGFHVVGYGCTTCIGNSGPLPAEVSRAIAEGDLSVCSVLSGNRNFEGRIHGEVRLNYLASPPLVVAFALAGTMDIDMVNDPVGKGKDGRDVYLKDIWPTQAEVAAAAAASVNRGQFIKSYANVFAGDANWQALAAPEGEHFSWDDASTYIRNPPYFAGMGKVAGTIGDIEDARALALLGDSVTTDHISPAGAIKADSPAGIYLRQHGVEPKDFNSYGSRRGNHEVMMRGTFANIRLRNRLAPGTEGGVTVYLPNDKQMSIYDAAMEYKTEGVPAIIIAGKEYGSGSSRDWAAKGPMLLGVKAVIAEGYERIHRSNLVGMGILPLQFMAGDSAESLGLSGRENFAVTGVAEGVRKVVVTAGGKSFETQVRIDTPKEWDYYRHGGILQYVLRQLASA